MTTLICPTCQEPAEEDELEEPKDLYLCQRCSKAFDPTALWESMECPCCNTTLYTCPSCKDWTSEDERIEGAIVCPCCDEAAPKASWAPKG